MNNSYITIIKEKRTALSRKRIPLNQNGCTANFRIGVPFEQNLHIRMDCEETFMTKEQWEKVISNSGFMIKTIYPQEDEPMAVFGQRVFAVIKEN